jgi:lipopolysaccharide export system protein LptA
MRYPRYTLLLFLAALLSLTMLSYPAQSASSKDLAKKDASKPIVIDSKTLEADNKKKTVTFTDDVKAQMDNFSVYCKKMVVYYVEAPEKKEKNGKKEKKGSVEAGTKIDKIVATGDVKIIRAEGGVATGQKAVYYQLDEKLVLTGKPVVKQKNNFVEGDRITLFLKEDRSVVESLKGKKVRAVIFPGQDKGQGLGRGK